MRGSRHGPLACALRHAERPDCLRAALPGGAHSAGGELPGLRRYILSRNAAAVRGSEAFYLIAEREWDSMDDLRTAFGSPQGQATAADVAELAPEGGVKE